MQSLSRVTPFGLLLFALSMTACNTGQKIGDDIPRTPASHALHPKYIRGPVKHTESLATIRRNLSRGTGFVFGVRFLFESDLFLRRLANDTAQAEAKSKKLSLEEAEKLRQFLLSEAPKKSDGMTCFLFENDATEKEELEAQNYEMKLENLDGTVSYPLSLTLDPAIPERLKKERLPFTISGEACTPNTLDYESGFRVTYLRKDKVKPDAKEPIQPTIFEWTPWKEGVSQDLYRHHW